MSNSNNHGRHLEAGRPSEGQQLATELSIGETRISNDQFRQGNSRAIGRQGLLSVQLPSVSVQPPSFVQRLSTLPSNISHQQPSLARQYSVLPVNVGSELPALQSPVVGSSFLQNNNGANESFQQLANQVAQLPESQIFVQTYGSSDQRTSKSPLSASLVAVPVAQPNPSLQIDGVVDDMPRKTISQGATIIPCRARAIAKDHNEKTAYFVIPRHLEHGDGLLCSHITCRNKGIRFVYCRVCDQPVAKANFTTRHQHPEVFGQSDESTAGVETFRLVFDEHKRSGSRKSRKKRTRDMNVSSSAAATSAATCGGALEEDSLSSSNPRPTKGPRTPRRIASLFKRNASSSDDRPYKKSQDKRKRPPSVSSSRRDTSTEMNNAEGSSPDSSSNSFAAKMKEPSPLDQSYQKVKAKSNIECEWLGLLDSRPSKHDRKNMKAWMERVLFTSEYVAPEKQSAEQDSSSGTSGSSSSGIVSGLIADAMGSLESIHQALSAMNQAPSPKGSSTTAEQNKSSTTSTSTRNQNSSLSNSNLNSSASNQNSGSSNGEEDVQDGTRQQVKNPTLTSTTTGEQKSETTSNENTATSNEEEPATSNSNQNSSSSNGEDDDQENRIFKANNPSQAETATGEPKSGTTSNENATTSNEEEPNTSNSNQNSSSSNEEEARS